MTVDINQFITQITSLKGPARANHFLVEITNPSVFGSSTDARTLSLLCETTSLPGIAIGTDDHFFPYGFGVNQKMPWGVVFTDLNLMFYGDNQGIVHNMLTKWVNNVINFNNKSAVAPSNGAYPFLVNYLATYATTVTIKALNEQKNEYVTYTLYNCYPTAIYDVQGSWSMNDQLVQIPVRLTFQWWSIAYNQLTTADQAAVTAVNTVFQPNTTSNLAANDINNLANQLVTNGNVQASSISTGYQQALSILGGTDILNTGTV